MGLGMNLMRSPICSLSWFILRYVSLFLVIIHILYNTETEVLISPTLFLSLPTYHKLLFSNQKEFAMAKVLLMGLYPLVLRQRLN